MLDYLVVEISGRQYKVAPDQEILVDFLGDEADFSCDKVLLRVEDGKMSLGNPYLNETVKFLIVGKTQEKIRTATYHAKANYRRVKGMKLIKTKVKLA